MAMSASGGGYGGGLGAFLSRFTGRAGLGGGRFGFAQEARITLPTNQNKSMPITNMQQW